VKRSAIQRRTPLRAKSPMKRTLSSKKRRTVRNKKSCASDMNNKRFRSERYLAFVRSLPCCVCGGKADSAHHVIAMYNLSGMGLKAPDSFVMPVCDGPGGCHARIHAEPDLQRLQPRWLVDTINRGLDVFTEEPIVGALCEALEFIAEREAE